MVLESTAARGRQKGCLLYTSGEFVINPSQEQWKNGDLNLTVASTSEKVIMIEAGANEIPEQKMIEAI